jgi:hypothetical protein
MLSGLPRTEARAGLVAAMQAAGVLADPMSTDDVAAVARWVDTFLDAFGDLPTIDDAVVQVRALRAEAVVIPALDLERLRNRQVLFFLDAVGQYVADQPELRGLQLEHDLPEIAKEFRLSAPDAFEAVRVALTAAHEGPPLELLFPLLGHDRIMMRIGAVNSHLLHGRGLEPLRHGPGGAPFRTLGPREEGPATETESDGS